MTLLLFPQQLWSLIGVVVMFVASVLLLYADFKDKKDHLTSHVDSLKKRLEVLKSVLSSKFGINSKNNVEELISFYREYIDKEDANKKRYIGIVGPVFSAFACVLTISLENILIIGISFETWLYLAIFLSCTVVLVCAWIYSYSALDTYYKKYQMMVNDLRALLLVMY